MEKSDERKNINGFCYISGDDMVFISLFDERADKYDLRFFKEFIENNGIDETYMILANRTNGVVYPLYKYPLKGSKTDKPISANKRDKEDLILTCYKICIEMFRK